MYSFMLVLSQDSLPLLFGELLEKRNVPSVLPLVLSELGIVWLDMNSEVDNVIGSPSSLAMRKRILSKIVDGMEET